jgi:type VI secretion system secreted protein Hcp
MAIADMFLKVQGVRGESGDQDHKDEIDVVSWSWGLDAPTAFVSGEPTGTATVSELRVVKRVDLSSPTLMSFLRSRKPIPSAQLTVRKAGSTPLEYFKIEMDNVRVNALKVESQSLELLEEVRLGFQKVRVTYVPQAATGGAGGGANVFETDAHAGK